MRSGGGGVPGVWTDLGTMGGNSSTDPNAPDLPPRPRDLLSGQAAARINALRKQNMDFLLASNRVPGVGNTFSNDPKYGFQIASNQPFIKSNINPGKLPADINPPPLTFDEVVRQGKIPPPLKTLPGNPLFDKIPNQGYGFLISSNRPPAK